MNLILTLVAIFSLANGDLLGYNRGVNNNYQHHKIRSGSAISKNAEKDYRTQLISFMLEQGNTNTAMALLKQLKSNNARVNNSDGKQRRRRRTHKRRHLTM